MGEEQSCCVTGHRDIPLDKISQLKARLLEEILTAIEEGYTHFISGFASGVDLIFAEIVAELKKDHPITLEAAIPHAGRMRTSDSTFHDLLKACDVVNIHSDYYYGGCFMARNRYMVDHSSLVFAVYDGRESGGTASTVKYANKKSRRVLLIDL